ncbi:MAG: transaldolase [Epsilonproteobacteria bacterium]|nr:transaldolase [Campylobacterota bacterium]
MIDERSGFSLWVDFIERDFINTKFKKMLEDEIVDGATSNPSIFANAIINSPAYKEQLKELEGLSAKEKYEALAVADIKAAAKALRPFYEQALEGYVSIEVDPFLSNDAKATIEEGVRLFKEIDEPNVMIKVPATEAGYEAMEELMAKGISVNATLVFSPKQAIEALNAMKKGVSRFTSEFDEGRVEGVISIFVSRFDRKLDDKLKKLGIPPSKTGIFNAAKIYNIIRENRHPAIKALFASTGVKEGQDLPKDYYITSLYAKHSINTAPLDTIEAFEANPNKGELALPICPEVIDDYFKRLEQNGISMPQVYKELMDEGLKAFEDAFSKILDSLK